MLILMSEYATLIMSLSCLKMSELHNWLKKEKKLTCLKTFITMSALNKSVFFTPNEISMELK